jgi:site-specific recombinase XerD
MQWPTKSWNAWRPSTPLTGAVNRHYYASLLIRHGESVKVVQARLGHASASETLDTYSHLWPDSEDRTRRAVDEVLAPERKGEEAFTKS